MNVPLLLSLTLAAANDNAPPPPPAQILEIKRVYVDQLTGGAPANQMRDLLIASLQGSRLFIITEDEKNADAILRGAADEDVYTENHVIDESISGRVGMSRGRGSTSSSSSASRTRDYDSGSLSVGERESSKIQERRRDAMATVRLVMKNGDVVWSTTQESGGAKFRGAGADVANKIARQLALDIDRARRSVASGAPALRP